MPTMGALFPTKFGATDPAERPPKRLRKGSRASGANPRALGTNPKALRQRQAAAGGCGSSSNSGLQGAGSKPGWANRAWRQAEIARRSTPRPRVPAATAAAAAVLPSARPEAPTGGALAQLGSEQRAVVHAAVSERANIFFTGNAGTGKSHLLRVLVAELRRTHGDGAVFVTASTGIAAANIGGITIHSFAGVGFGVDSAEALLRRIGRQPRARWHACRVLILDELSMLDGQLLDKLDHIARAIRSSSHGRHELQHQPFGGIQLVLCGDFFQLPPVKLDQQPGVCFAFNARCWSTLIDRYFVLRQVRRCA